MSTKVLIFGIDGGTLHLAEPWAKSGELPHLARLMREGTRGVLRSTLHPLTPPAWASFLTGMNPGKHGLYDFGCRRPGSYELSLTTSATRRAPGIWQYLEAQGLHTGLINVPLTFPLEPLERGFMISGMHTPTLREGLNPSSLLQEIEAVAPDYAIDVMSHWYQDLDRFLADVHRMTEARGRVACHLHRKYLVDCFILVLVAVDRVSHLFYRQMADPWSHNRDGRGSWKYSGEVLRAYRAVDRVLGDLLAQIDNETVVVVMSDHGFGPLERDVSLNQFFLERGLLAFSPEKVRRRLPVVGTPFGAAGRSAARGLVDAVVSAVPPLRRRSDAAIRRGEIPLPLRRWEYVDWSRTLAYSQGLFGNVHINLKGREPEGCVEAASYELARERVVEALSTLTDPEDGGPIVDRVYRREEVYRGPCLEAAPDLLVVMRDYAYMTRGACELTATQVVAPPALGHTGNHRRDGMVILWGPGIRQGMELFGAHITDIMPTVLSILGVPVPEDVDGRVLSEALERPEHLIGSALRLAQGKAPRSFAPEQEVLIRRRLKNLGYLE